MSMNKAKLSLRLKPLTPLFFGPIRELSPSEQVRSFVLPTAYTIGGLALRLIGEALGGRYDEVERMVKNDEIQIKGPYVAAEVEGGWRYFIPAPLNVIEGRTVRLEG